MKYLLLFLFLPCFLPFTIAQGLIFDEEEYKNTKRAVKLDYSGQRGPSMPNMVDLKPYCPPPIEQQISSCVGVSLGYYTMTIMYAHHYKWSRKKIEELAFSNLFIYNQAKQEGDCDVGAKIQSGIEILKNKGNIFSNRFDKDLTDCEKQPTNRDLQSAYNWKIKEERKVFELEDKAGTKIQRIKKSLSMGKPVIVGILVRHNFYNLCSANYLPVQGNSQLLEGDLKQHALVIVGYNDDTNKFCLVNSWGKDWGENGFCFIDYNDLIPILKTGHHISINTTIKNPVATTPSISNVDPIKSTSSYFLQGDFELQTKTFYKGKSLYKTIDNFKFSVSDDGYYKLQHEFWVGDRFHLRAENMAKDKYVYVFSINDKNDIYINFPIDNVSPMIPADSAALIIPGNGQIITIDEGGKDYLCALYSDVPISTTTIKNRLNSITQTTGSLPRRIRGAFRDILVSPIDSNYQKDRIGFYTNSKKGKAVILIIELNAKE